MQKNQNGPILRFLTNPTGRLAEVWDSLVDGMVAADARATEVQALRVLTDEELRRRGLTRERIAAHVYRDRG